MLEGYPHNFLFINLCTYVMLLIQGKDKTCIIVSLVRSNDAREVGSLLKDWRRVNVAISRAKTKLILIGSKETIIVSDFLEKFINIMETNKWIVTLPLT